MNHIYETKEYKRARKAYVAQSAFEYFITILITDAYLAKLLTAIGISDSLAGIIASFVSFSFLFQLLSISLATKIKKTKPVVVTIDIAAQLFYMMIYAVPFINLSVEVKSIITASLVMLGYFAKYLVSSIFFKWSNSFVDPMHRAEFSAGKEIISLLGGIVFTLAMGYAVDAFDATGNISGGFIFTAAVMLVLNLANLVSLLLIPDEAPSETTENSSLQKGVLMKKTFGNKSFRSILVMTVLWEVGRYTSLGFMGTYKTNDLLMSIATVQIINNCANFVRMAVSKPFGRFTDKFSYAKGFQLGFAIAGAGFLLNAFTTPKTWWLIALFTTFYYVSLAGLNQNSFNVLYKYVDNDYIVPALAIKNSIAGVLGFAASIISGRILAWVQANGNTVFGLHIYGQQLLSFISFLLIAAAMVYAKLVLEKQKTIDEQ